MCAGPTVEEPCPAQRADYGKICYDEITGAQLPAPLVEEAVELEVEYMRGLTVYKEISAEEVQRLGAQPVGVIPTRG